MGCDEEGGEIGLMNACLSFNSCSYKVPCRFKIKSGFLAYHRAYMNLRHAAITLHFQRLIGHAAFDQNFGNVGVHWHCVLPFWGLHLFTIFEIIITLAVKTSERKLKVFPPHKTCSQSEGCHCRS